MLGKIAVIIRFMRPVLPILALSVSVLSSAATVDGIKIHSTVRGSGPNTIVFVHGWTCDESSWANQVPVFEKNYRVITLDLPGHGKSGSPTNGPLTMELFAKSIEAVRVEAKAGKIVLVGHSMGTPVIREYARAFIPPPSPRWFPWMECCTCREAPTLLIRIA